MSSLKEMVELSMSPTRHLLIVTSFSTTATTIDIILCPF